MDPPSVYDDEFKRDCLKLYANGMGFRAIERVEGENMRLRHYLARLHRKTLCYSKFVELLKHSMRLLLHYLKFGDVPIPQ